jgi:GNAT superfamily N-acetyltransferase
MEENCQLQVVAEYEAGPDLLRSAVAGMAAEDLRLRPVEGRWSTLEVVCHVSDTEQLFADRMKRTLAMDRPLLVGADSYWAAGRPLGVVRRAVESSLCFGLYAGGQQVGFARVVTDRATFAWLYDVFVLEGYRGRGLGKWLVECVVAHPALQGLRRLLLATRDAHGLYERYGFRPLADPARFLEVFRPDADPPHPGQP